MRSDNQERKGLMERARSSLLTLGFGLLLLGYLIAIDRPYWFTLRPASGTAAAMSRAADLPQQRMVADDMGAQTEAPASPSSARHP